MTDVELRIKSAELMGWDGLAFNGEWWGFNPVSSSIEIVPDYPNDIAAAWELVEKMREMELYPNIENVGIHGALWNVWLMLPGNMSEDIVSQDENVKRAITMAFIVAIEPE